MRIEILVSRAGCDINALLSHLIVHVAGGAVPDIDDLAAVAASGVLLLLQELPGEGVAVRAAFHRVPVVDEARLLVAHAAPGAGLWLAGEHSPVGAVA